LWLLAKYLFELIKIFGGKFGGIIGSTETIVENKNSLSKDAEVLALETSLL